MTRCESSDERIDERGEAKTFLVVRFGCSAARVAHLLHRVRTETGMQQPATLPAELLRLLCAAAAGGSGCWSNQLAGGHWE